MKMLNYISSKDISPLFSIGPQSLIKHSNWLGDPGGFCVAWSTWYADLRLTNPDIPRDKLLQEGIKAIINDPVSYKTFIRNYSAIFSQISNQIIDIFVKIINTCKLNLNQVIIQYLTLHSSSKKLGQLYKYDEVKKLSLEGKIKFYKKEFNYYANKQIQKIMFPKEKENLNPLIPQETERSAPLLSDPTISKKIKEFPRKFVIEILESPLSILLSPNCKEEANKQLEKLFKNI